MDISATSVTQTRTPTSSSSTASSISSDFDTFLTMLTTQISNQDPLNPMNAEEFAVQLATFSGVEQQVRTNDLLEMLGLQLGQGSLGDMASWVGLDVRADMPVQVNGDPVEVVLGTPPSGSTHEMVAYDRYGTEVWRGQVDPSEGKATWNALDDSGIPVAPGLYTFTVESFDDAQTKVATTPTEIYAPVREVRADPQGIILVFNGGVERYSTSVRALREHGFDGGA